VRRLSLPGGRASRSEVARSRAPVLLFRLDVWDARGATPWTNRTEYLFSVNTHTPPTMAVDSGEKFTIEVRGPFDDVEDIRAVPTPFTPACDGHPLAAPITGPIAVRGAKPGDVVAIDLSTSQRRLILASQPMVRRLSPGASRIRTPGPTPLAPAACAEKPGRINVARDTRQRPPPWDAPGTATELVRGGGRRPAHQNLPRSDGGQCAVQETPSR